MKKIFKIAKFDCSSCATMLELDLEDAGYRVKCSFVKSNLQVELDKDFDESKFIKTIEGLGYKIN